MLKALIVSLALFLTACGGGGGPPDADGDSNLGYDAVGTSNNIVNTPTSQTPSHPSIPITTPPPTFVERDAPVVLDVELTPTMRQYIGGMIDADVHVCPEYVFGTDEIRFNIMDIPRVIVEELAKSAGSSNFVARSTQISHEARKLWPCGDNVLADKNFIINTGTFGWIHFTNHGWGITWSHPIDHATQNSNHMYVPLYVGPEGGLDMAYAGALQHHVDNSSNVCVPYNLKTWKSVTAEKGMEYKLSMYERQVQLFMRGTWIHQNYGIDIARSAGYRSLDGEPILNFIVNAVAQDHTCDGDKLIDLPMFTPDESMVEVLGNS